jgi:hypothetical protein
MLTIRDRYGAFSAAAAVDLFCYAVNAHMWKQRSDQLAGGRVIRVGIELDASTLSPIP